MYKILVNNTMSQESTEITSYHNHRLVYIQEKWPISAAGRD